MEAPDRKIEPTPDTAIVWREKRLWLLDQRYLPAAADYLALNSAAATADAIRNMVVRGAPAIGVTAAYGVVLAGRDAFASAALEWKQRIGQGLEKLRQSRPTAVNLFWALDRMQLLIDDLPEAENPEAALLQEAVAIHEEDVAANRRMGALGASLIDEPTGVITHCNAGALATGGYGTALGVIRSAHAAGLIDQVFADETRPWLQGSRLTAWELLQDGIPVTLLADGAAASHMSQRGHRLDYRRRFRPHIAANGMWPNKIGTYGLAVAAKFHRVKVMVAAPASTIDIQAVSGRISPLKSGIGTRFYLCEGRDATLVQKGQRSGTVLM
ncbi:S-methyl-5-thioribose-1-phosphate isomerase [endosymbiont of Lamellibrachia barhami]|uniref:S-methyl-5-thioribose-1-phosphate isomerase n=1 Tax=endosymbiont of Lamellibrachia barhami TaxID=205975 RepID=UPI003F7028A7